jgi:hypothetical protein
MGRPPKLTPHQQKEAIKRRDAGDESLADMPAATTSVRRRSQGFGVEQLVL